MEWKTLTIIGTILALGIGAPVSGQVDPNQQPADPRAIIQQLRDNMNNAGVTPQDLAQQIRQQVQDGTFDPQALRQQLQQQGIITPGMQDQVNQFQNQLQTRLQQRQMTTLQQQLNATDEEWTVLAPKIQRVLNLNTDLNQATSNVPQGGGAGQQTTEQGPVAKALAELRTVLQDVNAADSDVTAKLTAYRNAWSQVKAELGSAREDLRGVVTLRQEAILLNMNILD